MSDQKAWVAHYDPGVPATLAPYPDKTLVDFLRGNATAAPSADALLFKGTRISWAELDALSDRFASTLLERGIKRGDCVALVLPNTPQFLIAEIGAWKAGATVLPLNPLYTAAELLEPLRTAGAVLAVVLTPFYQRLKDIQPQTALKTIVATSIKEYLPPTLRVLFTLLKEKKDGHRITLADGDVWFQRCLDGRIATPLPTGVPAPDDDAVMLLSGGTTGTPKAVVGKHRHLVTAGVQLKTWLSPPAGSAPVRDVTLLPLPLFHVYACAGVQTHAIVGRTPIALVPNPRDLDDLLKTIERVKPTLLSAVPALFIGLLNHPKVKQQKVDFRSIRVCFSGSAPLMAATKSRFEEMTGGRIVEGYSLTEAMMACCVNPLGGTNKVGSVGIPLPDVDVAIVNTEPPFEILPRGETGEIAIRAPQVMSGYWRNPDETVRTLRTRADGSLWLHTGDLGYLDEDHYLFIVDRLKDLIKTSGFQVWPREVEEALTSHADVAEAGVAGVPDESRGEAVKAWVVRRSGSTISSDELRSYCRTKLAPYKVPSHVEFRDSLPKTMAGKVLRRALSKDS